MSYSLSEKDLNPTAEYQLSLEDISPAKTLAKMASDQTEQPEEYRPQIQEEFSNPTHMPGFENLSKKEKLQRIAMSQFDPANQTPTGGFVPPGAYEAPETRMAASIIPGLMAPEFAGSGILPQAANAVMRTGFGSIGNTLYESPDIKNMNDFIKSYARNIKQNALLELPGGAARLIRGGAEFYNPASRYGAQKANDIKNEYQAAKALQRETYRPVFEKYGNYNITPTPEKYLSNLGLDKKKLYPESKKIYEEFLKDPSFQNLHNLQSKIGGDIRQLRSARNKPLTLQRFEEYRNNLNNSAKKFLGQDKNALSQYELGSHLTRNLVEPYRANPTLHQISAGTHLGTQPHHIENAIKKGKQKITNDSGKNVFTAIPEGHPLEKHMNDISGRQSLSHLLKAPVPEALAKWLPNIGKAAQNKTLGNVFKRLELPYYAGARGAFASMNEQ
jgi:hypothetical protein